MEDSKLNSNITRSQVLSKLLKELLTLHLIGHKMYYYKEDNYKEAIICTFSYTSNISTPNIGIVNRIIM
ncbi:hypothetical protein RIR_jg3202.t1 [Rhizophagus irregularis DAOM 181602=DAOM 197198]|nr:hypothetical protein RIR_jg3202.t1 [Rhizophagus irregularis DAOM 181602=DAOM 197198]